MEPNLCVLMDFENIAAGAEREGYGRFDTSLVMTRLKEKGRVLIARSYGDWGRFAKYKQAMLENGIQSVELTSYRSQEKNRADIALAVDAMELAFSRNYIDTFVLLSGDSDFTPLVMRLRELNRRVIGIGTRRSSSRLLVESCDEFIFYESIIRSRRPVEAEPEQRPRPRPDPTIDVGSDAVESIDKDEAFRLVVETIVGVQKDEAGPVQGGRLKQSLLRKAPTFDESEYGYAGFARFLEAARDKGLVRLSQDEHAGGYRVDLPNDQPVEAESAPEVEDAPLLRGEPGRLAAVLTRMGLDPTTALMRHIIVHEFVDHVSDRSRKKKRNTLLYTVGDVARRCRQADPPVRQSQVRSLLSALFQAGELRHSDGNPIRKDTSSFVVRGDGEELLRALRAFYVDRLLVAGETLRDGRALSILLWGDEDHATQSEELVAWTAHAQSESARAPTAQGEGANGDAEERSDEDGEEPTESSEAPAASSEPAQADAAEASEDAETEEGAAEEAASSNRRRRRRRKRRSDEPGEPSSESDAAESDAAVETPVVETPVVETPVVETPVVETPIVETPVVETPVVETPIVEPPAVETPAEEPAAPKRRRTTRKPKVEAPE